MNEPGDFVPKQYLQAELQEFDGTIKKCIIHFLLQFKMKSLRIP